MGVKKVDYTALLKESLAQAAEIRKGDMTNARVTVMVNPLEVRKSLKINRPQFAALIGVSERTVEGGEQGRSKPTGAARALLRVAAKNPRAVLDALR
jgi:putative transcriptional regulator